MGEQQRRALRRGGQGLFQPARHGKMAVPGVGTWMHTVHQYQTQGTVFYDIAEIRGDVRLRRAPGGQQLLHEAAPVMVSGQGVDGRRQGRKRRVQHGVSPRVAVIGQISGEDDHVIACDYPPEMVGGHLQPVTGIRYLKGKPAVAAQVQIGKLEDTHGGTSLFLGACGEVRRIVPPLDDEG